MRPANKPVTKHGSGFFKTELTADPDNKQLDFVTS